MVSFHGKVVFDVFASITGHKNEVSMTATITFDTLKLVKTA